MRPTGYEAPEVQTLSESDQERLSDIKTEAEDLQEAFQSGAEGAGWWDDNTHENVLLGIEAVIEESLAARNPSDLEDLEDQFSTVKGWFEDPTTAPNSEE